MRLQEFSKFFRKNVNLIASVIPDPGRDFPEAVALIEQGRFSTEGLFTHTVPLAAVTADQGESFVWVVNPDDATLVKTPVRTGAYREDRVPVLEGLSADDWVVAAGTQVLREGQKVRPVDRQNRQVSLGDGQDGGQEGGE